MTAIKPSEVRALVSLLDDDNDFVHGTVVTRLRELGVEAIPHIEKAASAVDTVARYRVPSVLQTIRRDCVVTEFQAMLDLPELDLEGAVFLLARTAHPDLDVEHYQNMLDEWAERVREVVGDAREGEPRIAARRFASAVFDENGLAGNLEAYYDPDNSYINRVLDTRSGIPISLAAVGLLIARRASLPVVGIGMPTHFLLGYEAVGGHVLIDPFSNGKIITAEESRQRLEPLGIVWQDAYLLPVDAREIMLRMTANLFLIYQQTGDQEQLEVVGRIASMLQGKPAPGDLETGTDLPQE